MSAEKYVRALPEQVYEGDKILRVKPDNLHILGLYTLRLMLPPGAEEYAIETPAAIKVANQIEDDRWEVDFTMYAPDNSGKIDDAMGQFTNDGHMFLDNTGPSAMPQFGSRIFMGYFAGDLQGGPLMLHSSVEIPDTLKDLNFEPSRLLETV